MMTGQLKNFLKFLPLLFFISCSVSTPVIKEKKWDINIIQDRDKNITYESLSLFVNCYDDDGEDDIDVLFVVDDISGIYWELDNTNWMETVVAGDRWIGSNSIIMPDLSSIPRIPLRINVRDMAGEVAEDKIYITKKKTNFDELKFPVLIKGYNSYKLKSYKEGLIFLYADSGEVLKTGNITSEARTFSEIFNADITSIKENFSIYVSVKNGDHNLESGPW